MYVTNAIASREAAEVKTITWPAPADVPVWMRAIVGATVHRQHVSGVSPILRVDGSMGDGWCPAESGGAHPTGVRPYVGHRRADLGVRLRGFGSDARSATRRAGPKQSLPPPRPLESDA